MTVKELIYRLKDFPRDAAVCVRGRNRHAPCDAVSVSRVVDNRWNAPAPAPDSVEVDGDRGLVIVRIVGEEG